MAISRETYASKTPFVSCAVTAGTSARVKLRGGDKQDAPFAEVRLRKDLSNCGVMGVHYPVYWKRTRDCFELLALYLLTGGFDRGFPVPSFSMAVLKDQEGEEQRVFGTIEHSDCYTAVTRSMLRFSGPVEANAMDFCRKLDEEFPGIVSFSGTTTNMNSDNEIMVAVVNINDSLWSGDVLRKVAELRKKWGVS